MNLKNAIVTNVSTKKDRSLKITLETRELNPQQMAELFLSVNNEVMNVEIPEDLGDTKTPSQRLRNTLYVVYDSDDKLKEKFSTFVLYYNSTLERLIEMFKEKIVEQ